MNTFREVWEKLRRGGPAYQKAFVTSQVKRLIPYQIHALRKQRGWSQKELADRSGLTQGVISRAEDPDYGNMTFNTVISIACGFGVAFVGKFVPFSELGDFFVGLTEKSAGAIPTFAEENARLELLLAERENKVISSPRIPENSIQKKEGEAISALIRGQTPKETSRKPEVASPYLIPAAQPTGGFPNESVCCYPS